MGSEGRVGSILEMEERRFPLNLHPTYPDLRNLWDQANKLWWDPKTAIPWEKFERSKYSKEQLDAARLYWSRRAWTEYTGTAEDPAILLRLCIEPDREADARIFYAMQTLEETRHCIASYLFAERLGGYMDRPPIAPPKSTHHRGIRERILNPDNSFEAFVIAHICIGETIAAKMFEARYRHTTDPIAKELVRLIMRDEARHIQFGWKYMTHKFKTFTPELIAQMEKLAIDVVENSELKGFHCIWLMPMESTKPLIEANNITADAGLGASTPEQEAQALVESIREIRRDMAEWGIRIPVFKHEILGEV
jgi:hypothetical protein